MSQKGYFIFVGFVFLILFGGCIIKKNVTKEGNVTTIEKCKRCGRKHSTDYISICEKQITILGGIAEYSKIKKKVNSQYSTVVFSKEQSFFENGKVKNEIIQHRSGNTVEKQFYLSGKLKSIETFNKKEREIHTLKYDEKGILIEDKIKIPDKIKITL